MEGEQTARMDERHGCKRMQSSFENKIEQARADAVDQEKDWQRIEKMAKARESEAATLARTWRREAESLRKSLAESREREGQAHDRIRTLKGKRCGPDRCGMCGNLPFTDGTEGQGEQSPPGPPDTAMTAPPGGKHSLGELMQVTSAVGPEASVLPDQRAPTAPGPKVRASRAVKAVTKPKAAPNKPPPK